MARDPELNRFKTEIDLVDFALAHGYELDQRPGGEGHSLRLRSPQDKIIVARSAEDRHWIYFTVLDEQDSGSIIDFVQNRDGLSWNQLRQKLRPWLQGGTHSRPAGGERRAGQKLFRFKLRPLEKDKAALLAAWALTRPLSYHAYLEEERGLPRDLLTATRFQGRLRVDQRANAIFPHFDTAGSAIGWEMKNKNFTGFAQGGSKGLWLSHAFPHDTRLVLAESGIDALSYARLFADPNTRYASTGGGWSPKTAEMIQNAAENLAREANGSARVILAFDNDDAGQDYTARAEELLRGRIHFEVHQPPTPGQDWNNVLLDQQMDQQREGR
jgi:hypothetical protein